jgi:hypothetical protein
MDIFRFVCVVQWNKGATFLIVVLSDLIFVT